MVTIRVVRGVYPSIPGGHWHLTLHTNIISIPCNQMPRQPAPCRGPMGDTSRARAPRWVAGLVTTHPAICCLEPTGGQLLTTNAHHWLVVTTNIGCHWGLGALPPITDPSHTNQKRFAEAQDQPCPTSLVVTHGLVVTSFTGVWGPRPQ